MPKSYPHDSAKSQENRRSQNRGGSAHPSRQDGQFHTERRDTMGDKGGKKDKIKSQKQKASQQQKTSQQAKQKQGK